MKVTRLRIGYRPSSADRLDDGTYRVPPDDDNHYWAEAVESDGSYYYRAKGVTLEISAYEFDKVVSNPVIHYFSTAHRLHYRIKNIIDDRNPRRGVRRAGSATLEADIRAFEQEKAAFALDPITINLDEFTLAFMRRRKHPVATDDGRSSDEALEAMRAIIPPSALSVGCLEAEVSPWASWKSEHHFHVIPWAGKDFEWALFAITRDDNWGGYQWECHARLAGVEEPRKAAGVMLEALFKTWKINPRNRRNAVYRKFLAAFPPGASSWRLVPSP